MTAFARTNNPATSYIAAAKVNATYLESVVLHVLKTRGDMTSHEIAEFTGISLVSISPRMKPLCDAGKILRTAARRQGRTVWRFV